MTDELNTASTDTGTTSAQLPTGESAVLNTASVVEQTPPTQQTEASQADVQQGGATTEAGTDNPTNTALESGATLDTQTAGEDQQKPQDELTEEQLASNAALAQRAAILDSQDKQVMAGLEAHVAEVAAVHPGAVAAHGVLNYIESQIETEFGTASAGAKGWLKQKLWEVRQHLKI